jgi:hypothetical protein
MSFSLYLPVPIVGNFLPSTIICHRLLHLEALFYSDIAVPIVFIAWEAGIYLYLRDILLFCIVDLMTSWYFSVSWLRPGLARQVSA